MSITRLIIFILVLAILIILAYELVGVILAFPRFFGIIVWAIIAGIMLSPIAWKIAEIKIK